MRKYLFVILTFFLFVACGGGGSSSSSSSTNSDSSTSSYDGYGYLYDSALTGVEYYINEKYAGTTQNGKFLFENDKDIIEFSIGNIYLGKTTGSVVRSTEALDDINNNLSNVITTPMIINLSANDYDQNKSLILSQFLLSLDDDNNSENGITIDTNLSALLENNGVNYDFYTNEINENDLNSTFNTYLGKSIVSRDTALTHMIETTGNLSGNDYTSLLKPFLLNPFNEIKTRHTTQKKVKISGNIGTEIYIGEPNSSIYANSNFDGNMSNIVYRNSGVTIGSLGYGEITLDFNNDLKTYFDYYIYTKNSSNDITSPILTLHILKDHIPPYVAKPIINVLINEEQYLLQNIFAFDESDTKLYKVILPTENNISTDGGDFSINTDGDVTFKVKPDFDTNAGKTYTLLARSWDQTNVTDVTINVTLQNILDSAPILKTNTTFSTNIYEDHNISAFVYDLNSTLDYSLNSYGNYAKPDNDPALSPKYFYIDSNASSIFEVDKNTGIITLKDNINDLIDYEKLPNEINITFSIENNNSFNHNDPNIIDTNITNGTLTINILNKIDTAPVLNTPASISIDEKQATSSTNVLSTITKDTVNCDSDLSMVFAITDGNSENKFTINSNSGEITLQNNLDYETTTEYNLTITATNTFNTWYDSSEHNDSVNLIITINNQIDNPPVIALTDHNTSVPESTSANFVIAHLDVNGTIYDENQTTDYRITSVNKNSASNISNHPFIIDSSGVIKTSRQLIDDYEEVNSEIDTIFTIYANAYNTYSWDGNSQHNSNTISFDINITNVTDNVPSIIPNVTSVTIDENESANTLLVTFDVNTIGTQFDQQTITKYLITGGNYQNLFDINISGTQGLLKLIENNRTLGAINALDWETQSSIDIDVIGQNIWYDGTEHNSTTHTITIDLDNIVEVPPVVLCPTTITIPENIDSQNIIGYIALNSSLIDERSIDSMSISSGNRDDAFSLDFQSSFDYNNTVTEPTGILEVADNDGNLNTFERSKFIYSETNASANNYELNITSTNIAGSTSCIIDVNVTDSVESNLFVLVVGINFNDQNLTTFNSSTYDNYLENLIFGSDKSQLPDYLKSISKNKFTIKSANIENDSLLNGILIVDVNETIANSTGTDSKIIQTINEALSKIDSKFDFSGSVSGTSIDKNNDGNISRNEFLLLFITPGTEVKSGITAITSSEILDTNSYTLDGEDISFGTESTNASYIVVPENDGNTTIGIIAKYLTSATLGFQYKSSSGFTYDYDSYDLMGDGYQGYLNSGLSGSTPVHPSIFNKQIQGFIYPNLLKKGIYQNLSLYNSHKTELANSYIINDINDPNIYYLIENRSKMGVTSATTTYYDDAIETLSTTTGGLFIWKVIKNVSIEAPTIVKFSASGTNEHIDPSGSFNINILENNFNDPDKTIKFDIEVK